MDVHKNVTIYGGGVGAVEYTLVSDGADLHHVKLPARLGTELSALLKRAEADQRKVGRKRRHQPQQ